MDIGFSSWVSVGDLPTPVLTIDSTVPYAAPRLFWSSPKGGEPRMCGEPWM
jgi:hypothetical protein